MLFFDRGYPPYQISPKLDKNTEFQIIKIKLSKLEPLWWSHWIRNCPNDDVDGNGDGNDDGNDHADDDAIPQVYWLS